MTNPVWYAPEFLAADLADACFREMMVIDWEQRPDAPRKEHWSNDYGASYTYGRARGQRTYEARSMPLPVSMVRRRLRNETGVYYEGCFCNRYDGQRDWLGWHSDDDPGIDHSKPIAVVTLGQPRAIQYRPIEGTGPTREVLLEHGSLFVMAAGMQQTHMHRIPKAGHSVGTRISLTYRALIQ